MPEEDDRQDANKEAKEGKALIPDWGITVVTAFKKFYI